MFFLCSVSYFYSFFTILSLVLIILTCLTCPVQKLDRNVTASSYLNHLWKQVELAQWSKSLVLWYKMIIFWERYSLLKWGLILESILMNFISISRPVWKCPCKNDCKKSLFISDVMWSWNTNTTTTTTPRWGFMEITGNGGENEWVVAWQQCSLLSEAAQLVAHKGWAASYIVLKSYDFYKTSQH